MPPRRPRNSHVLEDLSRAAFEGLLVGPLGWAVRRITPDYGIDVEVEIFDNEQATGLTFKAQLKGMNRPDHIGPYRDVKTDRLDYWNSLDVPVLLVAYDDSSGNVYGRWTHKIDVGPGPPRAKKRVRFDDDDLLIAGDASLKRDVEIIRSIKSGGFSRPVPLTISVEDPAALANATTAIASLLRQHGLNRHVQVVGERPEAFSALLGHSSVRVAAPLEYGSCSIAYSDETAQPDYDERAATALTLLATLLSRFGQFHDAAAILNAVHGLSRCVALSDVAHDLGVVAYETDDVDLAIELLGQAADDPEADEHAAEFYYMTVRALVHGLGAGQLDELANALGRRVAHAAHAGHVKVAARWAYNTAQLLKGAEGRAGARYWMQQALELDPNGYGSRPEPYFLLGSVAWFEDDFEEAVTQYARAREISGSLKYAGSQLCDALMWAGRYEEAFAVSEELMSAGRNEWRDVFRDAVLDEIVSEFGITRQERREPPEEVLDALERKTLSELIEVLREYDAIHSQTWAYICATQESDRLTTYAAGAFLAQGPMMWLVLAVAALESGDEGEAALLIEALSEQPEALEVFALFDDDDLPQELVDMVPRALRTHLQRLRVDALTYHEDEASAPTMQFVDEDNAVLEDFEDDDS